MHGTVYILIDPRTRAIRYVGQTVKTLARRIGEHYRNSRPGSHLGHWIMQLRRERLRPLGVPIAVGVSKEHLDALEIAFIAHLGSLGVDLVNAMPGGSPHTTEEWRARQSRIKTGRPSPNTPEHHAQLNESKRGVSRSEETKRRISASKKGVTTCPRSPEVREKISAAQRGRPGKKGSASPRFDDSVSTEEIVRRYAAGESQRAIATALDTTQTTVQRRLATAGISTRVEMTASLGQETTC